MLLRPVTDADLAAVLALNQAEVPRVSALDDLDALRSLVRRCDLAVVAEDEQAGGGRRLAGFVLAVAPGSDHPSVNYRFFEERGTDHLYVDRIAVAPHARRRGVAGSLYDAVEERARATGRDEVTCEVNLRPRNEPSLRFHAARGFTEVGRQETTGGAVTVALLARAVR